MHLQWVAATGIGLALVGTARADLGPPPGQRYVTPIHIIETGREYPGYEFVAILGSDCGRAFRVDIRPGRPARLSDPGREYWQLGIQLFAVPKALADECRTAEDLKDLTDRGVAAGVLVEANPQSKFNARLYFRPVNDPRNDMIVRHRIVGLNPAEG